MGYRSDVKFITTKEGWHKINEAVKKAAGVTDEEKTYYLTEDSCWVPVCDDRYVLAEWEDIKWYVDSDDEITAFMEELRKFDHDGTPYEFLRVGEDYEDVERLTNWELPSDMPRLWLKREIEVEY